MTAHVYDIVWLDLTNRNNCTLHTYQTGVLFSTGPWLLAVTRSNESTMNLCRTATVLTSGCARVLILDPRLYVYKLVIDVEHAYRGAIVCFCYQALRVM